MSRYVPNPSNFSSNKYIEMFTPTSLTTRGYSSETGNEYSSYFLKEKLELGFEDIELLNDDWDSYGALAPKEETVQIAKEVCSKFPIYAQPDIFPENDGSIGLYWDLQDENCLKIYSEDNFEFHIANSDGELLIGPINNESYPLDIFVSSLKNYMIEKIEGLNEQTAC